MGDRRLSPAGAGCGAGPKRPEPKKSAKPKKPQDGTRRRPCRRARNDRYRAFERRAAGRFKCSSARADGLSRQSVVSPFAVEEARKNRATRLKCANCSLRGLTSPVGSSVLAVGGNKVAP
jgi:hypothetical protein